MFATETTVGAGETSIYDFLGCRTHAAHVSVVLATHYCEDALAQVGGKKRG